MTKDPKTLWQRQASDNLQIGLPELRVLRDHYEARVQREKALLAVLAVASAVLAAYLAFMTPPSVMRVGQTLLAAGLTLLFWLRWRGLTRAPAEDDMAACATFLRARLMARRNAASGGWLWWLAPLVPGLAVILTGLATTNPDRWPSVSQMLGILALWLCVSFVSQQRARARSEVQIAELDKMCAHAETKGG